jgi:hypothetical protein
MDILIRHPVSTVKGTVEVARRIPYDVARKKVERMVDISAFEPRPAVLSVYAQVMLGCDHCEVLPDGRHDWVNTHTGDHVRLEASL